MLDRFMAKLLSRAFLCFVFSLGVHGVVLYSSLSLPEPPVSAPIIGKPEPFKLQMSYVLSQPKVTSQPKKKPEEQPKKSTVKAKKAVPKISEPQQQPVAQKVRSLDEKQPDKKGEKATEQKPNAFAPPVLYTGNRLKPPYPLSMAKVGIEGEVRLECVIDSSGRATQIKVRSSSGHQAFEKSCIATLKKESFGVEWIGQRVEVPYYFRMR